jgi:hypothetical protein
MQENSASLAGCARLAQRHRLESTAAHPVLAGAHGTVQLNTVAAAILALCDGTRTAEQIVTDVAGNTHEGLAGDARAFLDAARRRGWIEVG